MAFKHKFEGWSKILQINCSSSEVDKSFVTQFPLLLQQRFGNYFSLDFCRLLSVYLASSMITFLLSNLSVGENTKKLPRINLFFQRTSFSSNEFSFPVVVTRFSFRPWRLLLIMFNLSKQSDKNATLSHHESLRKSNGKSISSDSRNEMKLTRGRTFHFDRQRTSMKQQLFVIRIYCFTEGRKNSRTKRVCFVEADDLDDLIHYQLKTLM